MIFETASTEENITLDGDFTLDLNGYDVTSGALIIQNGASVWGKGNIPVGKIGAGGRAGGGTYGLLLTTDCKKICDHLTENTFCVQKEDGNDEGKYWCEVSAVESMENAIVHPILFKSDPITDVEAKAEYSEIKVPINFHETPYYEASEFYIEKTVLTDENGKEIVYTSWIGGSFTEMDRETFKNYPVKDRSGNAKIDNSSLSLQVGVYKAYEVISEYLGKKEVKLDWGTGTLLVEKYITKTEPFEIRVGISRTTCVMPQCLLMIHRRLRVIRLNMKSILFVFRTAWFPIC